MRPHSTAITAARVAPRPAACLLLSLLLATFLLAAPAHAADSNVIDDAGLLDSSEVSALEEKAESLTSQYDVGVYIVTVNDYTNDDANITEAAEEIYNDHNYGVGSDRDGIMLLLSMNERDYAILTHGANAKYAFSDYATGELEKTFLPDFHNDEWESGFTHYLSACEEYLERAQAGNPVSPSAPPEKSKTGPFLIILAVSCGISVVVCLVIRSRNKSVHIGTSAAAYETAPVRLTQRVDQYTHTTRSVRRIEHDTSSSGGGSSVHISSGGSSVRSGKF